MVNTNESIGTDKDRTDTKKVYVNFRTKISDISRYVSLIFPQKI